MIEAAVTISLTSEARGGPFVFWDDLAAGCAKAAELGFRAVEIFPRAAEEMQARKLKQLLLRHRLKLAAVGTGAGWLLHKLSLANPQARVRREAQQFIANIIDFAAGFGAPAIIGSMQGRVENDTTREQALTWVRESLDQLGERALQRRVPLLLEPLNRYETNLLNRVADGVSLLESLETKNVKLLCDLFHMNIEEASIPAALRAAGKHLGHIHWADSNRQAIGFGHTATTPIVKALCALDYAGYISAEILPLPNSEAAARQTMKSYLSCFSSTQPC